MEITLSFLRWIMYLVGVIGIVTVFPFGIIGTVFLVQSADKKTETAKKALRKKGLLMIIAPLAFIAGSLFFLVILRAVTVFMNR